MLVTLDIRYKGFEDLVLLDYTLATGLQGPRGLCLARLHVVMLDTRVWPSIAIGPEDAGTPDHHYIRPDFDLHGCDDVITLVG